jgi:hypothetical protein
MRRHVQVVWLKSARRAEDSAVGRTSNLSPGSIKTRSVAARFRGRNASSL